MHYHFMGIGGIGMSGLALAFHASGAVVSGCDVAASDTTTRLRTYGIPVLLGHSARHITDPIAPTPPGVSPDQQQLQQPAPHLPPVDVLVASTGIRSEHQGEIEAARACGLKVQRRIEVLGDLIAEARRLGRATVGVVGTHGKTTTSALVASTLLGLGQDISAFVGGEVAELGGNYRLGHGPLVAEIDESDPLFPQLAPALVVVTNMGNDHVAGADEHFNNYHPSVAALHGGFRRLAAQAETVIYCGEWPGLRQHLAGLALVSYGFGPDHDYRATDLSPTSEGVGFGLEVRGLAVGRVELPMLGLHNVLNALAALAVAGELGLSLPQALVALGGFGGVKRRWQRIGSLGGAPIIDDYAHNPDKVAAAIAAARQTGRRSRMIFQPHRVIRTREHWREYAQVLMQADEVLALDIYSAGEATMEGVHTSNIVAAMQAQGHQAVRYWPDPQAMLSYLRQSSQDNDIIVTLGAGDVYLLAQALANPAPQPPLDHRPTAAPHAETTKSINNNTHEEVAA
jgi:UDP-N-acetylmuramate--alanine ligase